jgi:hypothetical protein
MTCSRVTGFSLNTFTRVVSQLRSFGPWASAGSGNGPPTLTAGAGLSPGGFGAHATTATQIPNAKAPLPSIHSTVWTSVRAPRSEARRGKRA